MIVDTHCHLHFDAFDADRQAVLDRARAAGIRYFVNVGTELSCNEKAHALAKAHGHLMSSSVGLHPHHAHLADQAMLREIENQIHEYHPIAIGEIGLDYFKSEADALQQKKTFQKMLLLAKSFKLPAIIHSRNALEDTVELLKKEGQGVGGVMHCFSYDQKAMRTLVDLGFYISFAGNITFKNAAPLLEVAIQTPLDRLLIETDSPYLAPQVYRGERNEPAYLASTALFLAAKRNMDLAELSAATTKNASRLFGASVHP